MKKYLLSAILALIIQSGFSSAAEDVAPDIRTTTIRKSQLSTAEDVAPDIRTTTIRKSQLSTTEKELKNWSIDILQVRMKGRQLIDMIDSIRHEDPSFSLPMVTTFEMGGVVLWRREGAEMLDKILSIFPNLSSLRLVEIGLDDKTAQAIVNKAPKLTHLVLDTGSTANVALLGNDGVKTLCEGLPNISRLTIGYQDFLTDDSIDHIVKAYPSITHLNLRCCSSFTYEGMLKIAENCTKLEYLNLQGTGDLTQEEISSLLAHKNLKKTMKYLLLDDDHLLVGPYLTF